MNRKVGLLVTVLVLLGRMLAGCDALTRRSTQPTGTALSGAANGERIYFTGADGNGNHIAYTGGPAFGGMMMGSYLTCAACHGPTVHGGQHAMQMQTMDAPPIYGTALNQMMVEESGGTPQPGGYSLESFRAAVVEGKHPDGAALNTDMPRWKLNDANLADLFAFLQSIPR